MSRVMEWLTVACDWYYGKTTATAIFGLFDWCMLSHRHWYLFTSIDSGFGRTGLGTTPSTLTDGFPCRQPTRTIRNLIEPLLDQSHMSSSGWDMDLIELLGFRSFFSTDQGPLDHYCHKCLRRHEDTRFPSFATVAAYSGCRSGQTDQRHLSNNCRLS